MVERNERRWVWCFAFLVLIVTTLPYLIGYWVQGDQWRFTGFIFGADDGNSYIAKMLQGATGDWLFKTPYTAYPQNGAFTFFPYILLGKLAFPPALHDQLVFLFQLFRWVGGFLVIFATYDFVALFIKPINFRRLATTLITIGGGLGWLTVFGFASLWQGRIPLEFYSPETFGFLSIMGLPHLEVARACLLWGIRSYLTNSEAYTFKRAFKGGLLWLALGLFQPLTVVIGWAVIGLHLVIETVIRNIKNFRPVIIFHQQYELGRIKTAVIMILISAPIVIYTFIAFVLDPFLRSWTDQNLILSPPFGDYILAYLNMLPFTVAGIVFVLKKSDWNAILLAVWVVIFPVLAYAPFNLQRRLPEGVWVAIVILAISVFENFLAKYKKSIYFWAGLAFISTIFFFVGATFTVASPNSPLFVPKGEVDAFMSLNQFVSKNDVVIATFRLSNELPAWVPVRTVIGHGPESINAVNLTPRVEDFFKLTGKDEDRLALINEFDIKYILLGPDQLTSQNWNPGQSTFAEMIYQNSSYQIYRINRP